MRPLAYILLFAFVLLTSPAEIFESLLAKQRNAQGSQPLNKADFKVNTVGLNASYDEVQQRLGAPQQTSRRRILTKTCGAMRTGTKLTLFYPGLEIALYGTPAGRNFRVISMAVTSQSWEVALGINVGMEEEVVREWLGEPGMGIAESGGALFIYETEGNTAALLLMFRRGKLVNIHLTINCAKRRLELLNRTRQ